MFKVVGGKGKKWEIPGNYLKNNKIHGMTESMHAHSDPPVSRPRFHGRFRQKLDEKGRVSLPAFLRRAIPQQHSGEQGNLILMDGPEGYVQALPVEEWEDRTRRWRASATEGGAKKRWRRRAIFGGVVPAPIDDKGRFKIPRELLEAAGIDRECLILGVDTAIEIWNPQRYFEQQAQVETDLSDLEDLLF